MGKKSARKVVVPATIQEAAEMLGELKDSYLKIKGIETELNNRVSQLHQEALKQAEAENDRCEALLSGLRYYANDNRSRLAVGKTISLFTGELFWRTSSRLVIKDENAVIAELEGLGAEDLLKRKVEIKKTVLRDRQDLLDKLKGVSVKSSENFYVKPKGVDVELPRKAPKRSKTPFVVAAA